MGAILGLECKLFRGTAGATATTLMTNVRDLDLDLSQGEADVTVRGTGHGWRLTKGTLNEASLTFEMVWDTTDASFAAIANSFFSRTPIALFPSDGYGTGLDCDWSITQFSRSEALEDAVTVSVTAKPTLSTREPAWVNGTGSSSSSGA